MKRKPACSVCGKTPAFKTHRRWFCQEHVRAVCFLCNVALSEAQQVCAERHYGMEGRPLCISCAREYLDERLRSAERDLEFQIRFQSCAKCGQVNDSRDGSGKVVSRFCQKCSQVWKDLSDFSTNRPKRVFDSRTVPFSKITGFKTRN